MRQARRTRHPFGAKLSLDDAVLIRARHAAGESARQLAAEYGVAPASVHALLRGEAHACTLRVAVEDATYTALATTAVNTGRSPQAVAAQLIEQGISERKEGTNGGRHDSSRSRSKR